MTKRTLAAKPKDARSRDDAHAPPPGRAAQSRQAETSAIGHLHDAAGNRAIGRALHDLANPGESAAVDAAVRSPSRQLEGATRTAMEARLGHDLGSVRVHAGPQAAESAEALEAQAFTARDHVVLGAGHDDIHSPSGQGLLAHELAHVIQQRGPRQASRQPAELESEASHAAGGQPGATAALAPAGAPGVHRKELEKEEKKPEPAAEAGKTAGRKDEKKDEKGARKKGFFDSIWSGLKGAASTVWSGMKAAGKAAWGGIKSAGAAAWEGMKSVGGWIAKGAEKVWAAAKWVGRQLWDKVTGTFARIGRWVTKLPARLGRLFAGLWDGLTSLKPWSLAWWKSLGKVDTWKDFVKWIGARAIDLAEILGIGEIAETAADLIKFNTRVLSADEIAEASSIFGASINYPLVRIDERALIGPSFTHREFTSFHTINGWGPVAIDTLIHELTHVWQYEHAGAIYMAQAVHAQAWGEGYTFGGAAGLQRRKTAGQGMATLNREQQAQVVQDFYRLKKGMAPFDPGANPASITDLPLYADFVKDVSTLSVVQLQA